MSKETAPARNLTNEEDKKLHNIQSHHTEIVSGYPAVDLGLSVLFGIKSLDADEITKEGNKYSWRSLSACLD